MIQEHGLLPALMRACPTMYSFILTTVDRWLGADGTISPCALMSVCADYVETQLNHLDYESLGDLFATVEALLKDGSPAVQSAAGPCFLENLLNIPDRLDPERFIFLLGPESRQFCQAYDTWTGVRTPGLWPEDPTALLL